MEIEIVPAVLVKERAALLRHIELSMPHVKTIHIDVMDNEFVPNKTVGPEDFEGLPEGPDYWFHWMVNEPAEWIRKVEGPHLHIVHLESKGSMEEAAYEAEKKGGRFGVSINPPTPFEQLEPYITPVSHFLIMAVNPGFGGQKYIPEVESKISRLRQLRPDADIEVDGGINMGTIGRAASAGANKLAANSAIFRQPDIGKAIGELEGEAQRGWAHAKE